MIKLTIKDRTKPLRVETIKTSFSPQHFDELTNEWLKKNSSSVEIYSMQYSTTGDGTITYSVMIVYQKI